MGYLVVDHSTMQKLAFYPIEIGFGAYSTINIHNQKIYTLDWHNGSFVEFDMENPTRQIKEQGDDSTGWLNIFNSYPQEFAQVLKTGFTVDKVA